MKKGRLEAYTDAVLAIVATIMVLELRIPDHASLAALWHEASSFLVYLISFVSIGASWYNHHYLFAVTQYISKRTYWVNNAWLFSSSLLPFATGWVGRFPNSRVTEFGFLAVNIFWALTYHWLSLSIIHDNHAHPQIQTAIKTMPTFRYGRWPMQLGWALAGALLIWWKPLLGLVALILMTATAVFDTAPDQQKVG